MLDKNFILNYLFCVVCYVYAEDYESDDKIYMVVSSDHHERTPRLEDFFWTGSGDGPPPPPDLPPPTPSRPVTPHVHTTTVLATVYLDSYPPQAVTDETTGECVLNCGEAGVPDSLEPEIPEDRRYWLLTIIQGSTPDSLQLRLARLYQKAFLRQQEKHLGIIKSLDAPTSRKKHDVHSFIVNKENSVNQIESYNSDVPFKYVNILSSMTPVGSMSSTRSNIQSTASLFSSSQLLLHNLYPNEDFIQIDNVDPSAMMAEIKATRISDVESWILATPTIVKKRKREVSKEELLENKEDQIDIPLETDSGNETFVYKREIIKPEQQPPVQVHIQNITESPESGSVQIVYVVLVGGRAVPAAVAARDMRLVRDAEVARELGAVVTTKAEPYLKAAEGLEGEAGSGGVHGTELWALAVGATVAVLLILALVVLLCLAHRRKAIKSAASLRAYRNELMREAERNQLKQVHEEKDGRLISVVSPSRTRPSSTLLPIYRAASASSSSTTSSGVSEVAAAAVRRRQKKPHALRMPQKTRVGTTDSLLEAAGVDSSSAGSAPHTPTSYLSMPSVGSFPRGNIVEPLSRVLEPISVRHLDLDSPEPSPRPKKLDKDVVPRRQMPSQLVRLGSIDKDPGVIGPLVWDLHCQRIKDANCTPQRLTVSVRSLGVTSPEPSPRLDIDQINWTRWLFQKDGGINKDPGVIEPLICDLHCRRIRVEMASKPSSPAKPASSRMRQRFNELMDDAFTLFGSQGSGPSKESGTADSTTGRDSADKLQQTDKKAPITQARNDNVRLPGSPYTAMDTIRGRSAGASRALEGPSSRPQTSRALPARAWGPKHPQSLPECRVLPPTVNLSLVRSEATLPPEDPALPLISAIKTEIEMLREQHKPSTQKKNIV